MTRPRLRVMCVVPHPIEGPSTRFRVAQFLPWLAQNGVDAVLRPLFTSAEARIVFGEGRLGAKIALTLRAALRRLGDVASAGRFDLVWILREAFPFGPPVFERLLAARAGRMVFDFDDAIYTPSTAFANPLDRLRDWGKPAALIRSADGVLAGSRHLADFALRAGAPSGRVHVLPTVVDTAVFRPDPSRRRPDRITIGWIGTPRSTSYLRDLLPVMRCVAQAQPSARFVFVGAEPFECGGLDVAFADWRLDRELADLQSFDIGIMPLADDEEARGKCGFKLIEYMAVGAAAVCSPVGANADIVRDGVEGLFASDAQGWTDALLRLSDDAALRTRLAAAGRARVEQRYSLAAVAPAVLAALSSAAAGQSADA